MQEHHEQISVDLEMNIRKTICLLCCVSHTVLALACGQRQQAMKPVVIVEDEQSADDKWLSMCCRPARPPCWGLTKKPRPTII